MSGQGPKVSYAELESVCESFLRKNLGTVGTCVDIHRLAESIGIELDTAPKKQTMEQHLIALRGPQDEATKQRAAKVRRQLDRLGTARVCGVRILNIMLRTDGSKYQTERCAYALLMPKALVQKLCVQYWGEGPIPVYGEESFLSQDRQAIQQIADVLDVPFLDLKKRLDQLGLLNHKPLDDPVYEATWRPQYEANLAAFRAAQEAARSQGTPQEAPQEAETSRTSAKKGDAPAEKPQRTRKPKPKTPPG